jgi:hypothetical protein
MKGIDVRDNRQDGAKIIKLSALHQAIKPYQSFILMDELVRRYESKQVRSTVRRYVTRRRRMINTTSIHAVRAHDQHDVVVWLTAD